MTKSLPSTLDNLAASPYLRDMKRTDIIAEYAKKGGPLPQSGRGIGSAFWRGYRHPEIIDRTRTIAGRAHRAGRARQAVEPNLPRS